MASTHKLAVVAPSASHGLEANARFLEKEIEWFGRVIETRINLHFGLESAHASIYEHVPPPTRGEDSEYARLIEQFEMSFAERVVLMFALIPNIRPQILDPFLATNRGTDQRFSEFGGMIGKSHGGFMPTCETASFVINGTVLSDRFAFMRLLQDDHFFATQGILTVDYLEAGAPLFSGILRLTTEYLNRLTLGSDTTPDYSTNFPAKKITTRLNWDDLVLPHEVMQEVKGNILAWLRHSKKIMGEWGLERVVKPGYRCLFYGPPGTGKTLTATLIGATFGLEVYRIDLSMVVSKYIGETEKSLANIFDQARNKNWILFFDEADALFGKRTQTSSSNDRYANQEVSYLLQRVEDFPGVVILATNLKANIDDAFARRFQASIYFPLPDAEHRMKLWQGFFRGSCQIDQSVDLVKIAENYELAGGAIANVVRFSAMRALELGRNTINHDDLVRGIAKELAKEGKTI